MEEKKFKQESSETKRWILNITGLPSLVSITEIQMVFSHVQSGDKMYQQTCLWHVDYDEKPLFGQMVFSCLDAFVENQVTGDNIAIAIQQEINKLVVLKTAH